MLLDKGKVKQGRSYQKEGCHQFVGKEMLTNPNRGVTLLSRASVDGEFEEEVGKS